MASSVSSNGGGNNVMIRSKADSIVAGGHTTNSMDERNTTVVGTTMMGTTATATGLAAGPERGAGTTADDSAISFSEEEEDDVDEEDEEDDEEEDDSGSIMADHQPESAAAAAAAAAAFNAAAAAAFQRQLLANFPLFHAAAADGSTKLDNDPSNASAMDAQSASGNPFETYIAAAAAAAAAAANAEALYRHQQQMTALTGGIRSEKRSAAHDSGTDDNDTSVSGKGAGSVGASAGIAPQQPSNKRRKQSKPVRISSDAGNEDNAAVTAFLAAQTAAAAAAAAAALFHQNPNASSEEEEEGSLQTSNGRRLSHPQMMEWTPSRDANNAGSNESEQEEGQIIRSSSDNSPGQAMLDQQLANRLLMAGNSSASARNLAEFLAASSGKGGGSFPLFPPSAYGGNWTQQQQMMMSMMAMNRSAMDDGEVSRSSSHSSGSPHGASDAAKKNHNNDGGGGGGGERESGERSNSESPFAFRNAPKYGGAAGAGFFPSSSSASSFGPAPHPFLFPFLSSASGHSPSSANQPMRGASGMGGSPSVGGIRIFNHEAYCELCNKEFCNKYFLKTHKANKHGIYTDNIPATSGGPPTTTTSSTTPTSSGAPSQQPFSVSSSFGPPLSLTVGAMTYPMHPPSTELAATEPSVTYSPIMTTSPSKLIYPTTATTSSSSTIVTTPGMNPSALMDFFPLWSSPSSTTTAPVVTTVNNTMTPAPLLPSVATMKQHLPGGIVNPEAYCDLCQKEFCNKYFLKRHKAKMHGIVPPDGSGVAASSASASGTAASMAPTGSALPAAAAVSSSGSSSHKRSKSHPAKASSVGAAVDLIKIPQTLPAAVASSPAASLANALPVANPVVESADHFMTGVDRETESRHSPSSTTTPFNLLMNNSVAGVGGINNETGGGSVGVGVGSVGSAKLDLSNGNGHRGGDNSLSLLKIPTPSLSTMFSSPPSMQMIHDGPSHPARHHSKTPSSSSSAASGGGGAAGAVPSGPQQMFTPERLRQMGVINTEAFCEICCKEFCNKYFLRTHKYKKHGIGSMPEQPQQQQQQSQSGGGGGGGMPESSSSSGMIRQHYNNNNNNNKNNSPGSKQQQQPEQSTEQKMPLNLATPPASGGSQQTADGGMPLTCDLCQRPFQSAYLLHMHRTYFHNQPPMADDSGATDLENPSDDNRSDNGDEDETRPSTNNSPPPLSNIKSEPDVVVVQRASEDADINNSGVTISADLQKLQSMIMELNGSSSSSAAAAAAVASMTEGDAALRRRCWIEGGKSVSAHNPPGNNGETANHFISASGGGIVKIVQPGETGSMEASVNPAPSPSTVCHLCGNKDFFTSYFLQMHMQNYHGIVATSGSNGGDPSAAAMEAAVAAAASQLGLDRLLDFGPSSANNGQSGGGSGGLKRSGRSSSSASPAANRSFCQICNKELCNKYFMKTHMLKMHGIHLEASGGGAQIGGVQCDICHKELCSKYFLKVHKQNTHGIGFTDHELMPNGQMLKEPQHQGVMDLSFHQHQQMDVSPAKSTTSTTECCPLCPKRFKSTKALKAHLSHDHSATSGSCGSSGSTTTSTCCYICNQQFGDVVALQVHLIKSHASHLMDHQTPPPPPPVVNTTSAPPATEGLSGVGQGCVSSSSSSPSSKTTTTLPPFQCSFCDFATGSLPYLFAHERTHHHPSMDPPATTTTATQSPVTQISPHANQQKIQCPLCGQQLPLEQFQTHLMAHQLPINFLHTLMPPSAASAGPSHADEEEDEDAVRSYQQQQDIQQGQRKKQRRRRRYRCSVCSRKFATRQLCLTHILQRHPPSIRSGGGGGGGNNGMTKSGGISSPTSPVSCLVQQQQRPLTCPRCGYATRQPQLLRLHLRTQQCIPVVARNPDLQQLPPYLAVPTSTASNASAQSRAVNNNGLLQVQGQHAHRQDFVLQAFLLTQPDADNKNKNKNNKRSSKSNEEQQNGHHDDPEDPAAEMKREHGEHNGRPQHGQDDDQQQQQQQQQRASSSGDNVDGEEEGQNQSCNFIPSLILLPVNRRIANPLSLTFSLTPA